MIQVDGTVRVSGAVTLSAGFKLSAALKLSLGLIKDAAAARPLVWHGIYISSDGHLLL